MDLGFGDACLCWLSTSTNDNIKSIVN